MHSIYRASILTILFLLLVGSQSVAAPPSDRISVHFSREHGGLEEILVSLYGETQEGGYKHMEGKPHVAWKDIPN